LKLNEKELSERINKIESLILDVGDGVEGNDGGDRLDRLNKALEKYEDQLVDLRSKNINDNSDADPAIVAT